jgi:hypothetical protein
MDPQRLSILYITGIGRSGSTLLANILGQPEGFFTAGELQYIWGRSFLGNDPCGCGLPFHDCTVWRAVAKRACPGCGQREYEEIERLHHQGTRTLRMLMPGSAMRSGIASHSQAVYAARLEGLYRAIAEETGCRCIVDSSKNPLYAEILASLPTFNLCLIPLVRGVRAVASSRLRRRYPDAKPGLSARIRCHLESVFLWNVWNSRAERLCSRRQGRHLRIRYEDFLAAPRKTVQGILDFFHLEASTLPFLSDYGVQLRPNHMVSGNENRFKSGEIEIIPDLRWKTGLRSSEGNLCLATSWPRMLGYGYFRRPPIGQRPTGSPDQ